MWFCAHAILYYEFLDGASKEEELLVWEHLYLIEANDAVEAHTKAVERARSEETTCQGSLTLNNRPARLTFAGIRKAVECQNSNVDHDEPIDGTELSYNEFVVQNMDDLKRLAEGEPVQIDYID